MKCESPLILSDWRAINCAPDLIIRTEWGEYKAHCCLILSLSPYFRRLFHYKLKSSDGCYELELKDVSDSILVSILNYVYNGNTVINEENIEELLRTCDKYNIISIMKRCEQYLLGRLDANNSMETHLLSYYYNCQHLKTKTEDFIEDNNLMDSLKGDSLRKSSVSADNEE